jgi:hypothetical protein
VNFHRPQWLALLGILGSLLWLSLNTVLSPDWGPPGSSNYLGYETINRLWASAFALMLCGYATLYARYPLSRARLGRTGFGLVVAGLVVMTAGNIAEFWFFTNQPYGVLNIRALAWISVLLGMLALLGGRTLLGVAARRQRSLPGWAGGIFAFLPPLFLVAFFAQSFQSAWLILAVFGFTAAGLAAWPSSGRAARKEAA